MEIEQKIGAEFQEFQGLKSSYRNPTPTFSSLKLLYKWVNLYQLRFERGKLMENRVKIWENRSKSQIKTEYLRIFFL